jgi:hypothetical protein
MICEKLIILIAKYQEITTVHLMNRSSYNEEYRQGVEVKEIFLYGNESRS